ncbi:Lreu_0056 family protein [Companilactobacillus furfuricola]|uniref:Lreu_0056 family protein n=1 Tax=Companilactobacillus furfuricola TaxID=1462575 RepID=UPI000F78DB8C|nr:DUF4767 domain-containing protein [Companilactobacillus furfuricola]
MKRRRIFSLALLFTVGLILTGCGGQNNSDSKKSQTATSKITTSKKSSDDSSKKNNQKQPTTLWNNKKDQQLESFINQWAPTMHQEYTKYDGTNSIKTVTGANYPADLSQESVNNTNSTIGWSKNGKGNYDYNVVAIYDCDSDSTTQRITYFFAFHDVQPVALVDQTTNGPLVAAPTKNTDVASNFAKIANGTDEGSSKSNDFETKSSDSASSSLERDPKLVALMVYQEAKGANLDFASHLMFGPSGNKYSISGGTGTSGVQFTINGDKVTYSMLDPNSADVDAEETMMESSISLSGLEKKFYSTSSQKQAVKSAANNLRSLNG